MSGDGSASHRLKKRKKALRARAREARDLLTTDQRVEKSRAIAEHLFALPEMAVARTVMVFSSFGAEVETRPMIERLAEEGRRAALPRVEGRDIVAVAYLPGEPVRVASYGAAEPAGGTVVPPEEIDLVVVPGLAFDRGGYRVGYGGGFYDRFLRRTRPGATKAGVAFAVQLVAEVPHGGSDVPVDLVVTEEGATRCR